jgi:hypothetical protein
MYVLSLIGLFAALPMIGFHGRRLFLKKIRSMGQVSWFVWSIIGMVVSIIGMVVYQ